MKTHSPAPRVRPIPAQGNALGSGIPTGQALKGRPKEGMWRVALADLWAALQGWPVFFGPTQGLALGWDSLPLWGGRNLHRSGGRLGLSQSRVKLGSLLSAVRF